MPEEEADAEPSLGRYGLKAAHQGRRSLQIKNNNIA